MNQVKDIAFIGYPVTDVPCARAFYEGLLGLKPSMVFGEETGSAWIEYDIGAGTLAIASMGDKWKPSSEGPCVALEVADFPATIAHLRANRVRITVEPMESPVCHMCIVLDPDGNQLCVHHRKARA